MVNVLSVCGNAFALFSFIAGKIRLFGEGGANLEYLRNVFVQLMLCENAGGRSHIVKAIASVLKLSAGETKAIEAAM